jgi:hypothetical protein
VHSGLLDVHLPNAVAADKFPFRNETVAIRVNLVLEQLTKSFDAIWTHGELPVLTISLVEKMRHPLL